jgi:hypothetical protein
MATLTTLISFNGTDGEEPEGSLIEDANGDLFGTTSAGGANVEPAGRWTAGRGVLALPACAAVSILELTIAGTMADRAAQREAA